MKRGAETYLTKDDTSDGESQDAPGEDFKKADDATLATRTIRGLPRRSLAPGTPPPTANTNGQSAPSSSTPKFNGFSGFGPPSSSSFLPPLSVPNPTTTPSQPFSSFPSFPSSTPAVATTASNTAKTFASFLNDAPPKSTKPATVSEPLAKDTPPHDPLTNEVNGDDSAALKYFTSLRGLNISLLSAITKTIEEDPFNDVTEMLERYRKLRMDVQKNFDGENTTKTDAPPSQKPASMPAPPAKFSGFGLASSPIPSTTSGSSGFVPNLTATSSSSTGFSFATPSSTAAPSPSSGFSFATPSSTALPSASGFSFSTPPTSQDATQPSINLFTPKPPTNSIFGSSTFTTSGPSAFGSTMKTSSSTSTSPFLFGNTSSSSQGPSTFGNTSSIGGLFGGDKPSASSTSSSPPKPSNFGGFSGFGKPASGVGSIGNPVGFGFGSPPRTPDGSPAAPENGESGFTFGPPKVSDKKTDDDGNVDENNAEGEIKVDSGESSSNSPLLGNNPHDEEGEGEEDEETVYSAKLKVFRLKKAEGTESARWVELGYGVLRLKKHKETGSRRMLLRNSSTGKININFNIYPSLKPSQSKKTVTFIGHDEGVSQTYSLRLQSVEQAVSLKDALEREISSVKAKSEDK